MSIYTDEIEGHNLRCPNCNRLLKILYSDCKMIVNEFCVYTECHHCGDKLGLTMLMYPAMITQKYDGERCPNCKSKALIIDDKFDNKRYEFTRSYSCLGCKRRWVHVFTDYVNETEAEGEKQEESK